MNFSSKPFYDLCINYECFTTNYNQTMDILQDCCILDGYNTIAVNHIINIDELLDGHKKKKTIEHKCYEDIIPQPNQISRDEKYSRMITLNRLTLVFSEKNVQKIIKSTNYNKYDIVALQPLSQGAFQFALGTLAADILSFGYMNKINFKLNRKICNQLVTKGIYFEISYNPLIVDSTQRKNCIYLSHMLHTYAKSTNIIVTSGAIKNTHIRSPYDVINLGFILGLSEQQAKNSVTYCQEQIILNSVGRRHGKTIVSIASIKNENVIFDSKDAMEIGPASKKQKSNFD